MTAKRRLQAYLFLFISGLFPVFANAATTEFRTLIDVDNSAATGCTVGGMSGVDHVLVTEVKSDATSGAVDRSYRRVCTGGSLGPQVDVDTSGWPVGYNPASGGMLVENRISFAALGGGMPTEIRLGFDATAGSETHSALTGPGGEAIVYPDTPGRRRSVRSSGATGRTFVLDGQENDWGTINPVVNGIAGGGSQAIRMIKAFAYANPTDEFLYFRVDANVGSQAPFAEDDEYSRMPGEGLAVAAPGVLANDGDPSGQPITALPVSPATHGDVTLNADGSFTYAPDNPASTQSDSFQYKATNGAQESNVAKVTITVSATANNAPTALNDGVTTNEDEPLNVGAPGVLDNDSDPDGDSLTATKLTDPSNGTAVVNADGSFTYNPDPDFFGTDSFTYQISDGEFTATATVVITVESVNDAPVVDNASFDVDENAANGTVVGTVTASDVDTADTRTFAITAGNTGGVFAINGTTGVITVADNAFLDFESNPTFTLTVTATDDGIPALSGSGTVTITVNDVNEAPVATNDAASIAEDGNVNVVAPGLLANDTDPENGTLTATKLTDPANGTATVAGNGAWTYQPSANFFGTDSFTYSVSDGTNTSNIATVTITVTPVNDAPVNSVPGAQTVVEDGVIVFSAANGNLISIFDIDAGANPFRAAVACATCNLTVANGSGSTLFNNGTSSVVIEGTLAQVNLALSSVTATMNPDFTGSVTLSVIADDRGSTGTGGALGDTDTIAITVTTVNDPPLVTSDARTTAEDAPLAFAAATLTTNDTAGPANESGQTITVTAVSPTSAQGGTVTLVAGTITYTPAANFFGADSFTYTVTDNGTTNGAADPQSAVGTVNVTVTEVNDPPAAAADGASTQEDTPLPLLASSLTTNDSAGPANESSQTLTVTAVSAASAQGGTVTLVAGTITYNPPANYFGPDSFTYTITDNGTTNSVPAPLTANGTVNVSVGPVNDAPVLTVAGAVTHTEGGAATNLATAANIVDVDDTNMESATIQITGNYAGAEDVLSFVNTPQITGTLTGDTLSLVGTDTLANYIAAIQAVQYTNTSDTPSTLQRTITWIVYDGTDISNTQTTTLNVTATNDGPVNTVPGGQTTAEDTPLTFSTANGNLISIADADAAGDDVQVTLNVVGGTVTLNSAATGALTSFPGDGTNTVVATGTVAEINAAMNGMVFNPTTNSNAAGSIQIVTDDLGNNPSGNLTDTDSVAITVTAVNDAPVLTVTGAVTHTEAGAATNLATAANITDVDDTNIESATIQITGNYAGAQDVLSFVNTPQITGIVVGDTLTLTGTDTLANYIAALQAVQYTNTSDAPSTLQRTITWTVNDGDTNSNTQTTTLDITATNDAPVNTVAVGQATNEDTPLVINGASIADPDSDPDDVQITLNVTGGTVTLDPTALGLTSVTGDGSATVIATGTVSEINDALGGMTFDPTPDSSGTASIQMVTDDLGNNPSGNLTDTDSFNITVNAVNDAPVLTVNGAPTFAENGPAVAIASAVNITDVDDTNIESATITITNVQAGDVLNFINTPNITGNYAAGVLQLTGSDTKAAYIAALQSITFSNASDGPSTTQRTITWVVNDGDTNSNTQNTTLDVTATNDGPTNTIPGGAPSTNEDTDLGGLVFSIADPDSAGDDIDVKLTVTNGVITLNSIAGMSNYIAGDGTLDSFIHFQGPLAAWNNALNGITFRPSLDFSGTAMIQIVTDDLGNNPSGPLTDDDTLNITVNAVNDAPVLTVTGSPTFAENGPAVDLTTAVNITDVDDTNIESAIITITNFQAGDVLNFVNAPPIMGSYVGGVLTLTGTDTKANYIAALDSITFSNASDNPSIIQRTITWTVNDGDVNSNTQNTTLDVTATNDAPVNTVAVGVTTNEDTPVIINGATIADPDADPDDVQITLNVTGGTVALDPTATLATLTGDGTPTVVATGTVAEINDALVGMTFTPTADSNLNTVAAAIQMVTDDQGNNPSGPITATDSFGITVNAVNDPPSFTPGADETVPEDAGPVSTAGWAGSISKGPVDESGQTLTFNEIVTGTTGTLTFFAIPAVSESTGTLTFQANANTCGAATVDITLTDDGGGTNSSPTHTLNITVQCVNDMPSFTPGGNQTVNEDAGAQTVNPWATAISPGPGETDNLTFNVSNNNNPLFTAGGQPAISPAGVLTYTPEANANGSATVSVTLSDDGVPPLTTSPAVTFTITVNALNDAPTFTFAGDPPFVLQGAGAQTVNAFATGITDGDPELTQVLTFNRTNGATTGTLTFDALPAIDPVTGNLTYTPTAGTNGTAAFTFTLSDDGATGGGNVNISGSQGFTIAVEVAPTVTLTSPLDNATGVSTSTNITVTFSESVSVTLVPASFKINCNAGPDLAFAYVGGTTNVTSVTLDPTATLPAGNCVVTVVANEIHDTDAFDPPDGLAVDYVFDFVTNTPPTAGDDSTTALGHVTLTVPDGSGVLTNDTDPDAGFDLSVQGFGTPMATTQGGTITFTEEGGYTYHSQALDQNITDTVVYTVTDQFGGTDTGTLSINLGPRFIYVDDDHPTVTPDGRDFHPWKTMQQAQTNSAPGDTILVMAGTYTDHITLQASQILLGQGISANHVVTHNAVNFTVLTAGAAPSVARSTAGATITLGASNTVRGLAVGASNGGGIVGTAFTAVTINESSINATGGPALLLDTGAATISLTSASSANSTTAGVGLIAVTGSVALGTGTITNPAGVAFSVLNGTAAITYAGNVTAGSVNAVSITNHTTGNITLSGTITAGASGGIVVTGKTSGTVSFTGAQNLNTGTTLGVSLTGNNGGTIAFSGAGLAISTTTGPAFSASGGGTVSVTGTLNTISVSGAGSGLTLNAITVAAGNNITFATLGAAATTTTGVSLTGLLGTGSVVVNGGTNSAVTGVSLTTMNTVGTSLSNCTINGTTGITGTSFGTLTISAVTLSNANQAMSLTTGTVNGTFTSVSSTGNGNVTPVLLSGVAGNFTVSAGGIADADTANPVFNVVGGAATIVWNGTMNQTNAAALVDVSGGHTGSITFGGNLTASTATGMLFNNADGSSYSINGAANAFTGGSGISITNGSGGAFTFSAGTSITNATASNSFNYNGSTGGVTYSGNITHTGASRAVSIVNQASGTITFQTNTIACNTSCTGLLMTNADGTVNFNGTNTLNGANAGVDIDTNSNGTFSFATTSAITTTTDTAFNMSASAPTSMTYAGTITQNSGRAVNIDGDTDPTAGVTVGPCGSNTFSGNVTSNGGTATGIRVQNCNAGTIGFSGANKILNTAASNAVTIATNGAAVNFTNGGLDIDTTSGIGFTASGGGSVTVTTGTNPNSINSTAGQALNVVTTTIGSANLNFTRIDAAGSSTGINLSSTGTTAGFGGLIVSGSGSAGSGGTIQTMSSNGVTLNSTRATSLSRMIINNNAGNGVFGDEITNFSIIDSSVTNNDSNSPTNEAAGNDAGLRFNEIYGTCNITRTTVSGTKGDNVRIEMATGTLTDLIVDDSDIGPNPVGTGGNGFAVVGTGNSNITVSVINASTFNGNQATGFLTTFSGTAAYNISIEDSFLNNNNIGVDFGIGGGAGVLLLDDNDINNNTTQGMQVIADAASTGASTVNGTYTNNTINGTQGHGMAFDHRGGAGGTHNISNNNISNQYFVGINLSKRLGTGSMTVRIDNNTVGASVDPFASANAGILVVSDDGGTVCMNALNNTSVGTGGLPGIRVRMTNDAGSSIFRIHNFVGDGTNAATVGAYIQGLQDVGTTAAVQTSGAGTYVSYTNGSCP